MFNGKNDIAVPVCMCCACEITYRWLRLMHMLYTHCLSVWLLHTRWTAWWVKGEGISAGAMDRCVLISYVVQICKLESVPIVQREGYYSSMWYLWEEGKGLWQRNSALLLSTTYTHVPGTLHSPLLPPSICISLVSSLFPFPLCETWQSGWEIWGQRGVGKRSADLPICAHVRIAEAGIESLVL